MVNLKEFSKIKLMQFLPVAENIFLNRFGRFNSVVLFGNFS